MGQVIAILPGSRVDEHAGCVAAVGRTPWLVRPGEPLDRRPLGGIILPGGRSPRLTEHYEAEGWLEVVRRTALPLLGTCAGLVILARSGRLDVRVRRAGFGRGRDFETTVEVGGRPFLAEFRGAPKILAVGAGVEVLSRTAGGVPVAVRRGNVVGTSFHPEARGDAAFHALWLAGGPTDRGPAPAPTPCW